MSRHSIQARNAQADAITTLLNGGYLRVFGESRPKSPDDPAPAGSTFLVECRFSSPAFDPA